MPAIINHGRDIARASRRRKLPHRIAELFFLWLSIATLIATPFVLGIVFAITKLF